MKLTVFVCFMFLAGLVFSQPDKPDTQAGIRSIYLPYSAFTPKQNMVYEVAETSSFREEDYRLADFLNESPPFNSKFSIYSAGFNNPKGCMGSAFTSFNITQNEHAAAFHRKIDEFDCSTKWERRGSDEPPEGSVFWKYKQWFADWERPDPQIYLLVSSSTYEIVYVCETRCEGFDGTLTYYREYVLLRVTEMGVMFVTIPVAVYESQTMNLVI